MITDTMTVSVSSEYLFPAQFDVALSSRNSMHDWYANSEQGSCLMAECFGAATAIQYGLRGEARVRNSSCTSLVDVFAVR